MFPQVTLQVDWRQDGLSTLRVFAVREADFNTLLADDSFKVPVPAGSHVVDFRDPSARPKVIAAPVPIDDAVVFLDDAPKRRRAASAANTLFPTSLSVWILTAIGLGVLLLGVGLRLLTRNRKTC